MELTQELLKSLLHYDTETGVFTWKHLSKVAGHKARNGYVQIRIQTKLYYAHRLAMLYVNGSWPKEVDHIDGDTSNTRFGNLREGTHAQNLQNRKRANSGNKTGILGVTRLRNGKFRATIKTLYRTVRLGQFETKEAAQSAYLEAKRKLHEFCTI